MVQSRCTKFAAINYRRGTSKENFNFVVQIGNFFVILNCFVQASAYGEACDSSLNVQILGDAEAARKLVTPEDDTRTEASDSEGELDMQEVSIRILIFVFYNGIIYSTITVQVHFNATIFCIINQ